MFADFDESEVFKRGKVYKGVYLLSLTNSFKEKHLELSYQRYSHRQRQRSLIIVNLVDAVVKLAVCVPLSYCAIEVSFAAPGYAHHSRFD
ncbi:unnamed protein product [Nezara viridula]|uniref:Uncharacterized protein n=1 Tax=Nezara viridula TaxID=85310 RepID=A0A9P0HJE6_NEZVI|nr:unnamed protein product [Nezara viridula]